MPHNYYLILLFFLAISQNCIAELPLDLSEVAKKYNCKEIANFLNLPGMIEPPYVYGYLNGEKENSAVFWCEDNRSDKKRLVIHSNVEKVSPCSPTIDIDTYHPGGLSLVKDSQRSLSWFQYLEGGGKGPDINVTDNFIQSIYDGTGYLFYCHNGKWLTLFIH